MAAYHDRFARVLAYIETHSDRELTVEELSGVAAFSRFHFHRQFSALFGLGVCEYVRLHRMKRASYRLAFRNSRIIDIALESGYDSPESFSRAFTKIVGQTPSAFRDSPQWSAWHAAYDTFHQARRDSMKSERRSVEIVQFPETRVAAFEHRGHPHHLGHSIARFIEWRKENQLPPRISATFNIVYDDFRFDLCAATNQPVAENAFGVVAKTIPAGRCAVLRHIGSDDHLEETVRYLYSEWLPDSGEEPRDFPVFFQRVKFFPDAPEHEAITDIFLPLA